MARPVETRSAGAPSGDRIAKLLARAGIASRREIERMIADGRVALNGAAIDTPATVLSSLNGVTVDGNPVARAEAARLFLYHKPTGLLVTERDPRGRPTIYDRLPSDLPRVVPVGRLDLNTEGLLLLTTDGGLKRELELPATGVERAYRARAYGPVTQAQLEDLMDGVEIDGIRYGSIDANLERRTGANVWIELTLTEGKNREVRRVLEYLGLQVGRLIRTRYGPFVLGDLPPGAVGEVKQHDLIAFRQALAGRRPRGSDRVAVEATGSVRKRSSADASFSNARPNHLPGEGGGPAAMNSVKVPNSRSTSLAAKGQAGEKRASRAAANAQQLDPGLRRSGKSFKAKATEAGSGKSPRASLPTEARPGFRTAATTDRSARAAARRKPDAPTQTGSKRSNPGKPTGTPRPTRPGTGPKRGR